MKTHALNAFASLSSRYGQRIIRHRLYLVVGVQLAIIIAANLLAFVFRFEGDISPFYRDLAFATLPIVAVVYLCGLWAFGLFSGLWRYVGLHDLGRIMWVSITCTAVFYGLVRGVLGWIEYPRSVVILTGVLAGGFLAGVRLAVRWFREWLQIVGPTSKRVVVVGAGNAGELLVRDLLANSAYNYKPVAFIDDDPMKRDVRIHGIPVRGMVKDIHGVVQSLEAQEIIVAIPSATPQLMQRVLVAASGCHVPIKTLPNIGQILDSSVSMRQVRPMRLEDLLQREPIQTDLQELHPLLEGKRVLVTGAGGSIGAELCRQIVRYRPGQLVLFERYENNLYRLELELRESYPQIDLRAVVGDVTDADGVQAAFRTWRPQLIFHAAAHKHVPLMENNAREAVRNNILGTHVVIETAKATGVERFVLISTDKAVNPTSVMGATKRVAEYMVQATNGRGATRFTVVRFGNVMGSNGSVVPLFAEQIRKGGPVTVTHPEIKRYFMTIPEAVQLILQASVRGQGGDVFVLDMGEQVRIVDLARNMIVLSGLVPERDIKIMFTGVRPGEKLYEELTEKGERVETTSHDKIKRVLGQALREPEEFPRRLERLKGSLVHADPTALVSQLKEMVPTYTPTDS